MVASSFLITVTGLVLHSAAPEAIAVFDIVDQARALNKSEARQLTSYIEAKLAESRFYVVTPSDELRGILQRKKSESYRSCFDESCQIEVGREVAAQRILRSETLRVGKQCILILRNYDLEKSTADNAATAQSECTLAGFTGAIDQLVKQLLPRRPALDTNISSARPADVSSEQWAAYQKFLQRARIAHYDHVPFDHWKKDYAPLSDEWFAYFSERVDRLDRGQTPQAFLTWRRENTVGSLKLVGLPDAASVNGKPLPSAGPLILSDIDPGTQVFRVQAQGFVPLDLTAPVTGGSVTHVQVAMLRAAERHRYQEQRAADHRTGWLLLGGAGGAALLSAAAHFVFPPNIENSYARFLDAQGNGAALYDTHSSNVSKANAWRTVGWISLGTAAALTVASAVFFDSNPEPKASVQVSQMLYQDAVEGGAL